MPEPTIRRRPGPRPETVHALVRQYVRSRVDAGQLAAATVPSVSNVLHGLLSAGKPPGEVTRQDVEEWIGRPGLAASTRRHQLSTIRTFFTWAVEHGHARANPTVGIARIRVPRALPRGLRADQVRRLLEVCPDARARLVVLLEVQCGLRSVEVSRLLVEHVDFGEQAVFVAAGKGGHQRLLPIPDEAWEALAAYLAEWPASAGPLIRCYPTAYQLDGQAVSSPVLVHYISKWMKAAGISEAGHALRHTFATDLVRRDVHVLDVQAALGHSNLATTSRYLPTNVAGLRDAMAGRRYGTDAPAEPEATAEPTLDAIGPLIDTVAALAAAVARIEARLDGRAPPRPALLPPAKVYCDLCSRDVYSPLQEHHRLHCPECGQLCTDRTYVRHRIETHGAIPTAEEIGCPVSKIPHGHTFAGSCICPWCGKVPAGSGEWLVKHFTAEHSQCPDCGQVCISVPRHWLRAHRGAVPA